MPLRHLLQPLPQSLNRLGVTQTQLLQILLRKRPAFRIGNSLNIRLLTASDNRRLL